MEVRFVGSDIEKKNFANLGLAQSAFGQPGLVKFFISIYHPVPSTSLNEESQDRSSGFQLCNAGILVEDPFHIQ